MSDRKKYVFYERSKKKRSVISEKVQLITTLGCVLLILGTVAAIASSGGFGGLESLPSASGPHKPKPKPTKPHASTPAAPEKPAPEIFNISLGTIRGVFSKSMKGRKFLSFKGVPYAVAPLGNSRFKFSSISLVSQPPQAMTSFRSSSRSFDASKDGPPCIQQNRKDSSEDCLFLNLYTPFTSVDKPKKLPVIVFIGGGKGLKSGSAESNVYGPEYLLDYDVVLVVIQYRLGALGFLSTGTEDATGNVGFKDQAMALRWVKKEINVFHGNPNLITLFGGASGSYSVSLHMVSPMTQNLFQHVIMMSGAVLPQTKHETNQLELAKKQARGVCCPDNDVKSMMECLRKVDAKMFAETAEDFAFLEWLPVDIWRPVIEPDLKQERFLTEDPIAAYKARKHAKIPMILGITKHEAQFYVTKLLNSYDLKRDFSLELDGFYTNGANAFAYNREDSVSRSIWKMYFGDKNYIEKTKKDSSNFNNMFRDGLYGFGMNRIAQLSINSQPVFFYFSSYAGSCSKTDDFGEMGSSDFPSTCNESLRVFLSVMINGDDQKYILKNNDCPITAGHKDAKYMQTFLDRWLSFAATGDPKNGWTDFKNNLNYLHITKDTQMKQFKDWYMNPINLWEKSFP